MEIVVMAKRVLAEVWNRDEIRVELECEPEQILDDMDAKDRLNGMDTREVIEVIGAQVLLENFTEEELAEWAKTGDYTDLLNAIGEREIIEWLSQGDE